MIVRGKAPSVKRQCQLLALARSTVYYQPRPIKEADLQLMRRIDELHLAHPYYGARRLAQQLRREGNQVGRRHVSRLMRRMGITALYRKPRTSLPAPGASIYPYLLSGLGVERANHVWVSDITYLPMAHGFMYLVAILDLASRKVLAFALSNTMNAEFCVRALRQALDRYGAPEIFNTDQGAQFTSEVWLQVLREARVQISMDGKGRWIDNVFIERLWRTVKYEEVYLHAYRDGREARQRLSAYFEFYNTRRVHQALDYRTPDEVYFETRATGGGAPAAPAVRLLPPAAADPLSSRAMQRESRGRAETVPS